MAVEAAGMLGVVQVAVETVVAQAGREASREGEAMALGERGS